MQHFDEGGITGASEGLNDTETVQQKSDKESADAQAAADQSRKDNPIAYTGPEESFSNPDADRVTQDTPSQIASSPAPQDVTPQGEGTQLAESQSAVPINPSAPSDVQAPRADGTIPQQTMSDGTGLSSAKPRPGPTPSAPKSQPSLSLNQQLAQNEVEQKNNQMALANNDAQFEQAIKNGAIKPNRIYQNMDTGQKIGNAIALVLGGIASANGQGNPALKALNDAVDKDIDAQKNDQSQSQNLWKVHNDSLHSNIAATLQARNNLLTDAKVKLEQQMGDLPGGTANLRAQALHTQLSAEIAQGQNKIAAYQTLANPDPGTGEQAYQQKLQALHATNPELAKDAQTKYIPGVGVARIPVAEKDREGLQEWSALDKTLDQALNFTKTKGTTLYGTAADQQAKDLQGTLQLQIGKLLGLNRINEYEAKKYEDMIKSPGAFRSDVARQSFNDLKNEIASKRQSFMQGFGITPFASSQYAPNGQAAPSMHAREGQTGTLPDGRRIIIKNGQAVPLGG